jgi:uncharacterized protein
VGATNDAASNRPLPAGDFSSWLSGVLAAIRGEASSEVPCGQCTACCTSGQFIHIAPDETDTLAHVPPTLTFPAPGLPRGHLLLGYDQRGHCPMLIDDQCSIYAHRPRTCRTYDCRVFPATGIPVDDDKVRIARQAERWQFSFPSAADDVGHAAVRAAADFLEHHADELPDTAVPTGATQRAVLAIQMHGVFLDHEAGAEHPTVIHPQPQAVRVEVLRHIPEVG